MNTTRRYFDRRARSFDRRGARRLPLREGPRRARELAAAVVASHEAPSVLEVGCGPGRVAEAVLDAGASRYLGVDLSPEMLRLARARLAGRAGVDLLEGDLQDLQLAGSFDVVLALGVFEYLTDPDAGARALRARTSSVLVASFTSWDRVKGPLRRAHYRLHRCPLRDYTVGAARELLLDAGFGSIELVPVNRRGFLVLARPA